MIWQLDVDTGGGEGLGRGMRYGTVLATKGGKVVKAEKLLIRVDIARKRHVLKDL